jgi:hypothetical protein
MTGEIKSSVLGTAKPKNPSNSYTQEFLDFWHSIEKALPFHK